MTAVPLVVTPAEAAPRPHHAVLRVLGLGVLTSVTLLASLAPILVDSAPLTAWSVLGNMPLWYLVTGLIVMARRPWHQVGWFLIVVGFGLALTSAPVDPAGLDSRWYPWLAWVGSWGGYLTYTGVVCLLVVFPDGVARRTGAAQRLGWVVISIMSSMMLLAMLSDPVGVDPEIGIPAALYPNPLGIGLVSKTAVDTGPLLMFAVVAGCVYWMWRRRRSEAGETRRRYTLVLYSFALLIIALVIGITLSGSFGDNAWWPAFLSWFAVPVAFTVAIVRHGLYGVDRLVSRTVTYTLVAFIVGAVYSVLILALPPLLGGSGDVVVAVSTLAAAAAFSPVRRRTQQAVDHRFNRSRYDATHEVDSFSDRLRSKVTLDAVTDDLHVVVDRTMQPETSAVWIRARE